MSHQNKVSKYLKIACVSAIAVLIGFALYGLIGCFVLLNQQPQFILPDGSTTRSLGFMVQGYIYCGILLSLVIVEILMVYFMYLRKKNITDKTSVTAAA